MRKNLSSERHSKATWLLINHRAAPIKSCLVWERIHERPKIYYQTERRVSLSMYQILTNIFGEDEARAMCDAVEKNRRARKGWFWPFK